MNCLCSPAQLQRNEFGFDPKPCNFITVVNVQAMTGNQCISSDLLGPGQVTISIKSQCNLLWVTQETQEQNQEP